MPQRFLLLHGRGSRRPRDGWMCWLAERLRRAELFVAHPQLPDPDEPDLARWSAVLLSRYADLGDGERVVICHSLSCALWYGVAAAGSLDRPADRVLLVAPPGPAVLREPVTASFDPGPWEPAVLARSSLSRIALVASDDDPYCQEGPAAELYGVPLGLATWTIPGAGHIGIADGYGPWPQLLAWCLDPDAPLDVT